MKAPKRIGRPPNIKVNIRDLFDYLDLLPDDHVTKQNLTYDKMVIIKRYVQELIFLEGLLEELRADIEMNGPVELFEQGSQIMRRANPSVAQYNACMRTYRGLVNKIDELLRGIDLLW